MSRESKEGPDSFPPGAAGFVVKTLFGKRVAGIVTVLLALVGLVFGIWKATTWVHDRVESVAQAVVAKTNDAVAAQEEKLKSHDQLFRRMDRRTSRIEGKLDVLGESLLDSKERSDRRWQGRHEDDDHE